MGKQRVAVFRALFPGETKHAGFIDLFHECLDSAFSADIACCEQCYNEFVEQWPVVILRNAHDFRNWNLIELYKYSDLAEVFTEDEFRGNLEQVPCPRCGNACMEDIWPYCFPFEMPEGFEQQAREIALISRQTPFLILTHPFAKAVLHEIENAVKKTAAVCPLPQFRGRRNTGTSLSAVEMGCAPVEKTSEGRYNHAGTPYLYLASDRTTVFRELGEPNDGVWISEVIFATPVKLLDLSEDMDSGNVLTALVTSALLSAPAKGEGWDKPEYVFSRFVADCARRAGFDGIVYPSVRTGRGKNMVLFPTRQPWAELVSVNIPSLHSDKAIR